MANSIHILDYTVIVFYLIGIFYLAIRSGRKTGNTISAEDQYLAGKSLTIPESLSSIIATEVSALTFLGIPAIAFGKDYSFIQIYFGAVIGRVIIAYIMLPRVYDQGLTIYTVMGKFGNKAGQKSIALFYSLNKFLAVGVRLFSGSILVAEFFSVNIFIAVAMICIITFFYTLIGGLKAVVRTDMVQMALFITGGIVAHFLIPEIAGKPWGELMGMAQVASKTSFYDFSNPAPFIIGVLGGIVFDMATHGVDQDFVQRLTANKTLKGAQFAIVCSSVFSIFVGLLFLGIGSLLWSYYQINTAPEIGADKMFAHFITMYFPTGLKGLMVAGVLAATMSTLDSSINALSACFHNDIRGKAVEKNESTDISFLYKKDTLMITCILMIIAFIASGSDGLLLFGLKITSWTAGSLLACFFATVVFKFGKLTPINVISAYVLGAAGVYANTFHLHLNWNWNVYFGLVLGSLAFYISEKITKKMRT